MISNLTTGAHRVPGVLSPTAATDLASMTLAQRPTLHAEYAVRLPDGRWWRELSAVAGDPLGTAPSVYRSRSAALEAVAAVIATATDVYGVPAAEYGPRVQLMLRAVRQGTTAATTVVGPWRPEGVRR
ncbi:hypothetical protein [Nocardia nova]